MEQNKNVNNVVQFPNLYERIIEKGLASLNDKDYKQAIELFHQARAINKENNEVNLGLLVSHVELQQYEDAKILSEELLELQSGDYVQIATIYLMVLMQLHDYENIIKTIKQLQMENSIPYDKIDHFNQLLSFSKRALSEKREMVERQLHQELDDKKLFEGKNEIEILESLSKLSSVNIRPFIDEIQQFLQEECHHPFLKTMLLRTLTEQQYEQPVIVQKFLYSESFVPSRLPSVKESGLFPEVLSIIAEELEHTNPSMLEMVQSLMERHQFLLYPFVPEWKVEAVSAAYHALALEYMLDEHRVKDISKLYQVESKLVTEVIAYIRELEGISYPII